MSDALAIVVAIGLVLVAIAVLLLGEDRRLAGLVPIMVAAIPVGQLMQNRVVTNAGAVVLIGFLGGAFFAIVAFPRSFKRFARLLGFGMTLATLFIAGGFWFARHNLLEAVIYGLTGLAATACLTLPEFPVRYLGKRRRPWFGTKRAAR